MEAQVPVYVLAGGKSQRFGSDKARAIVDGKPMILQVIAAVQAVVGDVTVVVDRLGRVADLGLREVADGGAHLGPLSGLQAALEDAPPGWIVLMPCDVMGLRVEWLRLLFEARQPGDLAVAFRDTRWQPLPALYHTDVLPEVRALADRALWRLLERVHARAVPVPPEWETLARIDTPADLARWRGIP
jgi:molybdopterin-guanine dinucleotide biosynthesis protein A